jgi:hypothetical protein
MKIYAQEIADGVSERIKSDTTVAYCSQAVLTTETNSIKRLIDKVKASSNPNQIDLYYIKSILVFNISFIFFFFVVLKNTTMFSIRSKLGRLVVPQKINNST